ncbi:MAG: thermonuclease family protein [Candidatus Aenigmatarchaeota archaeon]
MELNYTYKAVVLRWIDGDTCDLAVDLGFRIILEMRVRLYGINAPEIKGETKEEGLRTKAFVEDNCKSGTEVIIKTYKDKQEKYGRYLAEIWFNFGGTQVCLNQLLIDKKLASKYE